MKEQNKDNRDELIRDAQYRKGASIAYFNALNNAIALASASITSFVNEEDMLAKIDEYKTTFIKQHDEYYANVIAKIGGNFDPKASILKLEATTSFDELKKVWFNFSQDERSNKDIHAVAQKVKAGFSKK